MTSLIAPLGVAAIVAIGSWLALPASPVHAATAQVQVGTYWFCNSSYASGVCPTTINVGDTVQWNFPSGIYHTSTECGASCETPTGSPVWDSGLMIGGSYSYTFSQAGVYKYQCGVHGALMRGQVTVVGASAVGGIASLPDVERAALDSRSRSGVGVGLLAGAAAIAAGMIAVAGGAWYARRRRFSSRDYPS